MADSAAGSSFRTGLTEADLRSEADEEQEIKLLE